VQGTLPDGRVEVELGGPHPAWIAERLAGWGHRIDVVGPPEVREHLARIGTELVAAYA
jgi:predicted DNA-binding transcriptional regulator YafY